jgi:hypothetical protein
MSDYFAALLRASGLSGQPFAAPTADLGLEELEAFSTPTAGVPQARAETASSQPVAVPPAPAAVVQVTHPESSTPAVSQPSNPLSQPERAPAAISEASVPDIKTEAQPVAAAAISQQALVQSVLRWVASDPQQTPESVTVTNTLAAPTSLMISVSETATTAPAELALNRHTESQVLAPPLAQPTQVQQAALGDALATPSPPVLAPDQPAAAVILQQLERPTEPAEQPISISIGAIHLRVEALAPPAQPVAAVKPAPSKTTAAPRTAITARSGLSCRALRPL